MLCKLETEKALREYPLPLPSSLGGAGGGAGGAGGGAGRAGGGAGGAGGGAGRAGGAGRSGGAGGSGCGAGGAGGPDGKRHELHFFSTTDGKPVLHDVMQLNPHPLTANSSNTVNGGKSKMSSSS